MQIWLNVSLIRNKHNTPSRPLLPDTIMNKYKRMQYLESSWPIYISTVWHEILAVFPAIRKNKFPQIKITANIFPAKIYFRVNIL